MELLTSTSAEQFQQCAEFLPLRNRGFGTLAVTVLPVPYIRTSSAANVGTDKVSDKRQRHAIAAYVTFYSHRDLLCMQIVQA